MPQWNMLSVYFIALCARHSSNVTLSFPRSSPFFILLKKNTLKKNGVLPDYGERVVLFGFLSGFLFGFRVLFWYQYVTVRKGRQHPHQG
jgi:hypothetical protein